MTAKRTDPRAPLRAAAKLRAELEPRRISSDRQLQRISPRDEDKLVAEAGRRNRDAKRAEVVDALDRMQKDLAFIRQRLGRVAPGDHRGYLREIEHGIDGITRVVH